jgi:hypothetical protein
MCVCVCVCVCASERARVGCFVFCDSEFMGPLLYIRQVDESFQD